MTLSQACLSPLQVREQLTTLPNWTFQANRIEAEYVFRDFLEVMLFLNRAVNPIQDFQIYPRLTISYNRILISLLSPEAGGVTRQCIALAHELDVLKGK